jgi:hypothetical protein
MVFYKPRLMVIVCYFLSASAVHASHRVPASIALAAPANRASVVRAQYAYAWGGAIDCSALKVTMGRRVIQTPFSIFFTKNH